MLHYLKCWLGSCKVLMVVEYERYFRMKGRASSVSLRVNTLGYEAFTNSGAIQCYPFYTVEWPKAEKKTNV